MSGSGYDAVVDVDDEVRVAMTGGARLLEQPATTLDQELQRHDSVFILFSSVSLDCLIHANICVLTG